MMQTGAYVIIALTLSLILYGLWEYRRHQKYIYGIPIRIHVNGTRGKSSVTRLIGAALRESGIRTVTKVTGTFPRLILPDGKEAQIRRKEKANILEQLRIVKYCAGINTEALVIECMALQPRYQRITEEQMIHATLGVITNIRLDHLDVMGPGIREVGEAISGTIPYGGYLFTGEDKHYKFLEMKSRQRNTGFHRSLASQVSGEEMQKFSYIEHKVNVALALDVCAHLGIDRETALRGMWKMIPDEGVLVRNTVTGEGKRIHFYNAFAANDPESSLMIWNSIREVSSGDTMIMLLTIRHDRQSRAEQLVALAALKLDLDFLVLTGETTDPIADKALKLGVEKEKIINEHWDSPEAVFDGLWKLADDKTTIVGMGNMGAMGAEISRIFKQKHKQNTV